MGCASSAPAAATSAPKVSSFHEQLTAAVKARCRKAAPKPVPEYPGSARPRNSEIPAQKLEAAEAAGAPKSLDMVLMKLPKVASTFTACRHLFAVADSNGDGLISLEEFTAAAATLHLGAGSSLLEALFDEADLDKSKGLEFSEFIVLLALVWVFKAAEGEAVVEGAAAEERALDAALHTVLGAFRFFDRTNRGWLEREDVRTALEESAQSGLSRSVSREAPTTPSPPRRFSFRKDEPVAERSEMDVGITRRFREMDFSHDGKITFAEFVLAVEGWAGVKDDDDEAEESATTRAAREPTEAEAAAAALEL